MFARLRELLKAYLRNTLGLRKNQKGKLVI